MSISEVSDADLSRWIAEKLERKPEIRWVASRDGGESLAMHFGYQDECDEWCKAHPPYETVRKEYWPDMVNDPAMTDLLWKKLAIRYDFETALSYVLKSPAAVDNGSVEVWNRAVAEAFAFANGYERTV